MAIAYKKGHNGFQMKKIGTAIFTDRDEQKLAQLVKRSSRVILRVSSIFPFDFFPDDLIISENQVDIVMREFFFAEHIETVRIRDIQQVTVETSVLFAQLRISMLKPESTPIAISYLIRSEALLARRIIYGLIAVAKEGIDVAGLPMAELVPKLEVIGKSYD